MNVKNNKRKRQSRQKIERVFVELLQDHEIQQISVSDICKGADLNRSTFYANYQDIYELADRIRDRLLADFAELFPPDVDHEGDGALRMFRHIRENQLFYKTYFKLGYDRTQELRIYDVIRAERDFGLKNIEYHIEFFRNGLNAIIKLWLKNGCMETPEEMVEILKSEYRGR